MHQPVDIIRRAVGKQGWTHLQFGQPYQRRAGTIQFDEEGFVVRAGNEARLSGTLLRTRNLPRLTGPELPEDAQRQLFMPGGDSVHWRNHFLLECGTALFPAEVPRGAIFRKGCIMSDPTSAERALRSTIGQPVAVNGPITIVPYDPTWPAQYEHEAASIQVALGDGIVSLEHIGSTAVPGLPAKPIIDIQLLVENSADEKSYLPHLEGAGYTLRIREPEWEEHRVFKRANPDVNLHVFSRGSLQAVRHLAFRDYLRAHADERDRYAAVKLELAARDWTYMQEYADAKNEVIDEIAARAGITIPR